MKGYIRALVQDKGFTLVELMVVTSIAAIVLAIGLPNFKTQLRNNQSAALGSEFADALIYARSQAVKIPSRVSLCASEDGLGCTGTWSDGFIVFVDGAESDTTGSPTVGTVLKVWQRPKGVVAYSVKRGATAINFIRFTSLGNLARLGNDPLEIKVKSEGCSGNSAKKINVTLAGQASIIPLSCSERL